MAYATRDQLNALVGEDRMKIFSSAADDAHLDELLEAASGELDARLSRRYTVPIDTTGLTADEKTRLDALLARWTVIIAAWNSAALSARDVPKAVDRAYKQLNELLDKISLGLERLPFLAGKEWPKIKVAGDEKNLLTAAVFSDSRLFE